MSSQIGIPNGISLSQHEDDNDLSSKYLLIYYFVKVSTHTHSELWPFYDCVTPTIRKCDV